MSECELEHEGLCTYQIVMNKLVNKHPCKFAKRPEDSVVNVLWECHNYLNGGLKDE